MIVSIKWAIFNLKICEIHKYLTNSEIFKPFVKWIFEITKKPPSECKIKNEITVSFI